MRRLEKAAVDTLVARARNGYRVARPDDEEGSIGEVVSAARARADLLLEHRRHESRRVAADLARALGHGAAEEERSEEAEAGAILEAETAAEIHEMSEVVRAWYEAHKE